MRIAVVSDTHSNIVALDAVLAAAGAVDAVWVLGDIVGYGPDPDDVVARLREVEAVCVRGNHDAVAVGGHEIDWFNPDARAAIEWTRARITDPTRDWLAALPERREIDAFTLVHGSPRDPLWEYVTSRDIARDAMTALTTPIGLHGHTHVPIAFREVGRDLSVTRPADGQSVRLDAGRVLLNPGSVGQPRDGLTSASWLLLDLEAGSATWRRTAYDVAEVQGRMRAVGLPRRLVERLSLGA